MAMRIMVAAGGTGGHIFPAIAIADEMRRKFPQTEFLFVGTRHRLEAHLVPQHGYPFASIWISGFRRGFHSSNVLFPLKLLVSMFQSYSLLRKFRPSVVVGTGGFVCGPVLFVATLLRIPTVVHESNSYPGITTRLLAKRVSKVLLAFERTKQWLPRRDNVFVVGTPTREQLAQITSSEGKKFFGLDSEKTTVLVLGGSQGAAAINRAIRSIVTELYEKNIQLIWQTGEREYEELRSFERKGQVWVGAFIHSMEYAYAAADVVVCRAGATTLAEITRLGKAAIFIPFAAAAADHQRLNAQMLAETGAAVLLSENEAQQQLLAEILRLTEDESLQKQLEERCKAFGHPDAAAKIAEHIYTVATKQ